MSDSLDSNWTRSDSVWRRGNCLTRNEHDFYFNFSLRFEHLSMYKICKVQTNIGQSEWENWIFRSRPNWQRFHSQSSSHRHSYFCVLERFEMNFERESQGHHAEGSIDLYYYRMKRCQFGRNDVMKNCAKFTSRMRFGWMALAYWSTVEFRLISPPLSSGILAIHLAAQQRVITVTMVISNTLMTADHAASFANKCWATNW